MMKMLQFENYTVNVFDEPTFSIGSTDNSKDFDFVYTDHETQEFKPSSKHGVQISRNGVIYKSVILLGVGGATSITENSFIIKNNNIVVCCADCVFSLSLPELKLNWITQADSATCFGIYPINTGFIIHGELEISRLNENGDIVWTTGGQDIFVTQDGNNGFDIKKGIIYATDWNNDKYKIDFNGKFLSDPVE